MDIDVTGEPNTHFVYRNWEHDSTVNIRSILSGEWDARTLQFSVSPDEKTIGIIIGNPLDESLLFHSLYLSFFTLPDFTLINSGEIGTSYIHQYGIQLLGNETAFFWTDESSLRVYVLEVASLERELVGDFPFRQGQIQFSPCGRYKATTTPDFNPEEPNGVFIHDLKTNQTIFFEIDANYIRLVSWSRRDGIDRLIDSRYPRQE